MKLQYQMPKYTICSEESKKSLDSTYSRVSEGEHQINIVGNT